MDDNIMSFVQSEVEMATKSLESTRSLIPQATEQNASAIMGLPFNNVLKLQRTAGNQLVQRLMKSRLFQAKLAVSRPSDVYEREADQLAETMKQTRNITDRKPSFAKDHVRARIHTDTASAKAVKAFSGRAFTVGRDIFFGSGEYAPNTKAGQKLLAHELVHTVQQSKSVPLMVQRQVAVEDEKKKAPGKVVELSLPKKYFKPETPEEQLNRIIMEKPPEPAKKKTAAKMSKKFVSKKVGNLLGELGVPHKWHDTIKDAASDAVVKGATIFLDKTLDSAGLDEKGKTAIKKALEAGAKTALF
jgi:hypothetical protein